MDESLAKKEHYTEHVDLAARGTGLVATAFDGSAQGGRPENG
jgi:hypothetical protein